MGTEQYFGPAVARPPVSGSAEGGVRRTLAVETGKA
jgi:hypothetical protein